MRLRILGLLLSCLWLQACSSGSRNPATTIERPASSNDAMLSTTRSTRSLLAPRRLFVAHVPAAGKLAVIDQASGTVDTSIALPGRVDAAFPLGGFDGLATIAATELSIFATGSIRHFVLDAGHTAWDSALEAASIALVHPNGVRVIRHLGEATWQDESLPGLNNQTQTLPVFSSDGLAMLLLDTADGSYASYQADQGNAALKLSHTCARASALAAPLVSLAKHQDLLYWADRTGQLGALDIKGRACEPLEPLARLDPAGDIARILPRSPQSILVLSVGGEVYEWNGGEALQKFSSLDHCDFALAPVALPDDALVSYCLGDLTTSDAQTISYQSAGLYYFVRGQEGRKLALDVPLADLASLSVDVVSSRLFYLHPSALGRLTVVDLTRGTSQERKGLFVKNILKK